MLKKNLRQFNGLVYKDDAAKDKIRAKLDKEQNASLKLLLTICDQELSGKKDDMVDRMIAFLENPGASGKKGLAEKAEEKKAATARKKDRAEKKKDVRAKKRARVRTVPSPHPHPTPLRACLRELLTDCSSCAPQLEKKKAATAKKKAAAAKKSKNKKEESESESEDESDDDDEEEEVR